MLYVTYHLFVTFKLCSLISSFFLSLKSAQRKLVKNKENIENEVKIILEKKVTDKLAWLQKKQKQILFSPIETL